MPQVIFCWIYLDWLFSAFLCQIIIWENADVNVWIPDGHTNVSIRLLVTYKYIDYISSIPSF